MSSPLSLVDPDQTPPGGTIPSDLSTQSQREAATIDDLARAIEALGGKVDASISEQRIERLERVRGEKLALEGQQLLVDGQHRILADLSVLRGRVDQGDVAGGELLAWQAKADRRHVEIERRIHVLETQRPSGLSGAIAAVSARASQSEEAIVQQLREANEALRDERDARIAEDRRRLDAEIEAARTRRAWVTRAVVFLCGAGGLALIGLAGRACGG